MEEYTDYPYQIWHNRNKIGECKNVNTNKLKSYVHGNKPLDGQYNIYYYYQIYEEHFYINGKLQTIKQYDIDYSFIPSE